MLDTNTALDNATTEQQQTFLNIIVRCEALTDCGLYQACVADDPTTSYAGMHQPQITYDCQQQAVCRAASEKVDVPAFTTQCVSQMGGRLNMDPQQRPIFEASYTRCMGGELSGCAWVMCRNSPL